MAAKTRHMEDEFIAASGTDVTDAFRLYLRPCSAPTCRRLPPAPQRRGQGAEQGLIGLRPNPTPVARKPCGRFSFRLAGSNRASTSHRSFCAEARHQVPEHPDQEYMLDGDTWMGSASTTGASAQKAGSMANG